MRLEGGRLAPSGAQLLRIATMDGQTRSRARQTRQEMVGQAMGMGGSSSQKTDGQLAKPISKQKMTQDGEEASKRARLLLNPDMNPRSLTTRVLSGSPAAK